jgi:ATP-dependent Zn protease
MSEETARLIDEEVRRIVTAGEGRRARLTANRDKLETITQALMGTRPSPARR